MKRYTSRIFLFQDIRDIIAVLAHKRHGVCR
jgi:hypothetical protein